MDFVKGVRDLLDQKKGTAKGRTLGAITIHLDQLEMLNLNAKFSQIKIEVGATDEKLPALPPELVQIALSYLDEDTHTRAPAPMFELLAQDASGEALKKYTDTNAKNEAIVENIIQIIIADGKIPLLDSNAVAAAASVRCIPNLNLVLKKCIAADKRTKICAFVGQYCTNLRTLDLTKVHPLTPADLKLFSPLQSLRHLCLRESDIGDAHVEALSCLKLETCDLSNTRITGSTLNTLYRGITAFILRSCCKLTDAGVAKLGKTKDASGADVPAMQLLTCDLSYTRIAKKTFNTFHRGIINY